MSMRRIVRLALACLVMPVPLASAAGQGRIDLWGVDPLVKVFRDATPGGEEQASAEVARGEKHEALYFINTERGRAMAQGILDGKWEPDDEPDTMLDLRVERPTNGAIGVEADALDERPARLELGAVQHHVPL